MVASEVISFKPAGRIEVKGEIVKKE